MEKCPPAGVFSLRSALKPQSPFFSKLFSFRSFFLARPTGESFFFSQLILFFGDYEDFFFCVFLDSWTLHFPLFAIFFLLSFCVTPLLAARLGE